MSGTPLSLLRWFLEEAADFLATELRDWGQASSSFVMDEGLGVYYGLYGLVFVVQGFGCVCVCVLARGLRDLVVFWHSGIQGLCTDSL